MKELDLRYRDRVRLQEESIVEKDLKTISGSTRGRRVDDTHQNIDILGDVALRVRLDNLLDRRTRVQLLASCHCCRYPDIDEGSERCTDPDADAVFQQGVCFRDLSLARASGDRQGDQSNSAGSLFI